MVVSSLQISSYGISISVISLHSAALWQIKITVMRLGILVWHLSKLSTLSVSHRHSGPPGLHSLSKHTVHCQCHQRLWSERASLAFFVVCTELAL